MAGGLGRVLLVAVGAAFIALAWGIGFSLGAAAPGILGVWFVWTGLSGRKAGHQSLFKKP